ncbi:hypothetical protein JDV02_003205 [Purpureocillium takamizusanense]|uniref:Helicase C-terminal domain-containing protein n=1 Tax=Purpureocillium takamizusanense TaxID=2060973 RepID=A0A9Q8V8L3_9HYPO|nr:uncharacterized protein JDV02_003205 [Purpureocillium takamizusanense]UNI16803.1 hypothetical protein JDV02_003205 [Purpureocillium takamizusanense]
MAVVGTWQQDHPDDKIIVFVQFIMTAKVLGRMLELANGSFLYYVGTMTQTQKITALDDFKQDPSKKILVSHSAPFISLMAIPNIFVLQIATMQSGGQSLNLTAANRVIIVDPWWNTVQEKQAFCRVLRIGQNKATHLVRIMARAAIDERIASVQNSKDKEIDHALQDDDHIPAGISEKALEELFYPKETSKDDCVTTGARKKRRVQH